MIWLYQFTELHFLIYGIDRLAFRLDTELNCP